MKSIKQIGRITGILLLLTVIFGVSSMQLWGLTPSLPKNTNFLNSIAQHAFELRLSMVLDMIVAGLWLGMGIYLFNIIKLYRHSLAKWFLALWIVYFGIAILGIATELSLISLSDAFANASTVSIEQFNTVGMLKVQEYFWYHFFGILLYSSASLILYFTTFKMRLIPRWLSVLGLLAVSVVFTGCWLVIFGVKVPFIIFGQQGIFLIVLIIWLLIKGFREIESNKR